MARGRPEGVTKNVVTIGGKTYIYWRARYSRPGYWDGKRQRESKQFRTEREAVAWLRQQLREGPRPAGETLTVAQWVQPWLDGKEPPLKPASRQRAESIFRLHVNPVIGHKRLDRVAVDDVLALLRAVRRKGLDVNKVYMTARSAFDDAKKRAKVPYNVFENVETPGPRHGEQVRKKTVLSEDECVKLLTAINGDPLSPLFTLMLVTGMRLGEVLGLTWDRLDLDARKLEVRQTLHWLQRQYAYDGDRLHEDILRAIPYNARHHGKTQPYLLTPKTFNSERDIFLSDRLAKILRAHQIKQAERFGIMPTSLVFVTEQGTPQRAENIERALEAYAVQAELPHITPKDLRDSQSNFQRVLGVEAVTRAAGLGHSASVNLGVYSRASEVELRRAADLADRLIPG